VLLAWTACGGDVVVDPPSSSSSSGAGGSGGSQGTSGTSGVGGTTPFSASASSGSGSGGAPVTYTADAQPIFEAKCAPCHTTDDAGGSDFAANYADTQVAPNTALAPACSGVPTVGACTVIRIENGSMPFGAGCTGNPTTDAANMACLTAAEEVTLVEWIMDGQMP
jgi:hypothetical protein